MGDKRLEIWRGEGEGTRRTAFLSDKASSYTLVIFMPCSLSQFSVRNSTAGTVLLSPEVTIRSSSVLLLIFILASCQRRYEFLYVCICCVMGG